MKRMIALALMMTLVVPLAVAQKGQKPAPQPSTATFNPPASVFLF